MPARMSLSGLALAWASAGLLSLVALPAAAQPFARQGIDLLAQIPLSGFSAPAPQSGNDCWGHVSPSGREYAIMGLYDRAAFVEVTNPAAPMIVAEISHPGSLWGDMKVYEQHCYVVNESSGGMQVISMVNIDAGVVTLVGSVTGNGLTHSHNVALNPQSGFLYLCGSDVSGSGGGLAVYSLADPRVPAFVGSWNGHYVHDAQIVTYTSGPFAGREIAFCANESAGLAVVDVTNKASMFTVATRTYPGVQYAHQCWLSEDRNYLYLNDELDGPSQGFASSTTRVFDVSDIANPTLVNTFTSNASTAIDHNLYVHGRFIYESNYRSGLRVFDAIDPVNPVEVAFIDTYPENDSPGYEGTWSNFPFFPSGTIVISDINRGMFLVRLNLDYLSFLQATPVSGTVAPGIAIPVSVRVESLVTPLDTASVMVHARSNGGPFTILPMTTAGADLFTAALPAAACEDLVEFYFSAENTSGATFTHPVGAPAALLSVEAISGTQALLAYDMETAAGWVGGAPGDTATPGQWERGIPQATTAQPGEDHTPPLGVNCWVTGRQAGTGAGSFDVDNGFTTLLSPVMNLAAAAPSTRVGFWLWYSNSAGATPNADTFRIGLSNNGGTSWVNALTIGPAGAGTGGGWLYYELRLADILPLTASMRLRFVADDAGAGSLVEAALDDLTVFEIVCDTPCPADFDANGVREVPDIFAFLAAWFAQDSSAEFDGVGGITVPDIFAFLSIWFAGC